MEIKFSCKRAQPLFIHRPKKQLQAAHTTKLRHHPVILRHAKLPGA